jgi:hypothetical protein
VGCRLPSHQLHARYGPGGQHVVITGTNFGTAGGFAGTNAPVFSVNSPPDYDGCPSGLLRRLFGGYASAATSTTSFTIPAAPAITSFTPTWLSARSSRSTAATSRVPRGSRSTARRAGLHGGFGRGLPQPCPAALSPSRLTVIQRHRRFQPRHSSCGLPVIASFHAVGGPVGAVVTISGLLYRRYPVVQWHGCYGLHRGFRLLGLPQPCPLDPLRAPSWRPRRWAASRLTHIPDTACQRPVRQRHRHRLRADCNRHEHRLHRYRRPTGWLRRGCQRRCFLRRGGHRDQHHHSTHHQLRR